MAWENIMAVAVAVALIVLLYLWQKLRYSATKIASTKMAEAIFH